MWFYDRKPSFEVLKPKLAKKRSLVSLAQSGHGSAGQNPKSSPHRTVSPVFHIMKRKHNTAVLSRISAHHTVFGVVMRFKLSSKLFQTTSESSQTRNKLRAYGLVAFPWRETCLWMLIQVCP